MDKTQTKRLQEFAKSLEGLTYPEWLRLKTGIDAAFEERDARQKETSASRPR